MFHTISAARLLSTGWSRLQSTRRKILGESLPRGVDLDGSEGAMIKLAQAINFKTLILRHNDTSDSFHLDEHMAVCLGPSAWEISEMFEKNSEISKMET